MSEATAFQEPEIDQAILDEIQQEHEGLIRAELRAAIADAIEAHDEVISRETLHRNSLKQMRSIYKISAWLDAARDEWDQIPDAHRAFAYFESASEGQDPIGNNLKYLDELIKEYLVHHDLPQGTARNLRPLRAFVNVIHEYWVSATGRPFGKNVEDVDDFERSVVISDAFKFLRTAGNCLERKYTLRNYLSALEYIKRDRGSRKI